MRLIAPNGIPVIMTPMTPSLILWLMKDILRKFPEILFLKDVPVVPVVIAIIYILLAVMAAIYPGGNFIF